MTSSNILANAIRILSIDAIAAADSGHPGMPLGMADIATVLWKKFLKHNPKNPYWFNRDRFVLSNGHGSMLLYSLLHLTGYDLDIESIKNFRSLNSKTPGHPECTVTKGVDTTTGPLGQGLANAVGMAIAEKILSTQFNTKELNLIDHHTYVFVGDGCLMEGISHEACSYAGTLGLGKLIVLYDDNGISIDGDVKGWFADDTKARFLSYNWHVIENVCGHDESQIENAITLAKAEKNKPTLIICKTIIGLGSIKQGSEETHGSPLSADDIAQIRVKINWPHPPFFIPKEVYDGWSQVKQGEIDENLWIKNCALYKNQSPENYHELLRRINGDLPDSWTKLSENFIENALSYNKNTTTRKASQQCIEFYTSLLPELLGGSADLTCSNNTDCSKTKVISKNDFSGNYLKYGVREFAMSAIMTGLSLHGGFIPFGGTFLVFSDYARNAIRMSAIMKQRVIYIYTHDSIGLGEDGATHQPIEHISMLRLTPNLNVWRPACLVETSVAWQHAIENHNGPSCLLLSRQSLPYIEHNKDQIQQIKRGAYIIGKHHENPDVIIIATGSELQIALESASLVLQKGIKARVISMPCVDVFLNQDEEYKNYILPKSVRARIAIEASATAYWYKFVGLDGLVIGIDTFGESARAKDLYQYFEITVEKAVSSILKIVEKKI